jgi:hypothetical protein
MRFCLFFLRAEDAVFDQNIFFNLILKSYTSKPFR